MSDAVDQGITVTEIAAMDQPIDVSPETTAAFVGRALRGPLNTPVLLGNFGEFRRRFGDAWSRSSLGPAVKQFFAHGGQRLYVVRVANNARGAMICLPANGSALVLRALEPGSTECIRAAVDFDGIDDDESFNLTLQRLDPDTGLIRDQELFARLSFQAGSDRYVGDVLLASSLARVEQPLPTRRPEATLAGGARYELTYVEAAQAGTDGAELTDYDLVGSDKDETGLFSLQQVERFDLLYLPPPGKGADVGPAATLAAERYCRDRGAMLIVDPRTEWTTAEEAVRGVRRLGYASPHMLGYFPRVLPRNDTATTPRVAGGAIAGLLCKQDRHHGSWLETDRPGMGLKRELVPAVAVDDEDLQLLQRAGLNALAAGDTGRPRLLGSVTMGRGVETHREFAELPVQRFCLQLVSAIARATRWAVFETPDAALADRVRAQVFACLAAFAEQGAFADTRFAVECDAGVSRRADAAEHGVTVLLAFHPVNSHEPISLTLHLTADGCRVGSTAFAPGIPDCA